ncbi:MAG TPA: SMC-Scp complex subunit ScpB [Verrucomicrobiae bacterium]|mgnify:CR=1 FL=1|nr:SMC-Scp complex subunit ScpB [Verrucomicrobiae bacterium]
MTLKQVIEALLFAANGPLSAKDIRKLLTEAAEVQQDDDTVAMAAVKESEIAKTIEEIGSEIEAERRSYVVEEVAGGFQLATRPEYVAWVRLLYERSRAARLSGPALETLAIIAYRQPVSRAEIEAVRGVSVDAVLATIQERGLVTARGRTDLPGRPLVYETTEFFLEHFGLKSLDELPNAEELRRVPLPKPPASTEGATGEAVLPLSDENRNLETQDRRAGQPDSAAVEPAVEPGSGDRPGEG